MLFDIDTTMHNAGQHTNMSSMALTTAVIAPLAYSKATLLTKFSM